MGKIAYRSVLFLVAALPACSASRGTEMPTAELGRRRALEHGVLAMESGDFRLAAERLAPVAAICPVDALGRQAMLLLAASELDPANPARRPDAAAELAAFQLARRAEGEWEGALASRLYTLALDYGARPIAASEVPGPEVVWLRYLSDPAIMDAPLGVPAADSVAAESTDLAEAERAEAATERAVDAQDGGPSCQVPEPDEDLVMPHLDGDPLAMRGGLPTTGQPGAQAMVNGADSRALQAEIDRLRQELARKEQELDRIRRTLSP